MLSSALRVSPGAVTLIASGFSGHVADCPPAQLMLLLRVLILLSVIPRLNLLAAAAEPVKAAAKFIRVKVCS